MTLKSGFFPLAAALLVSWLGSGCAFQSKPSTEVDSTAMTETEEFIETTYAKQPERPFPTETLYSLLTAEMAGSRQQFDISLSNYAQQARETRDPGVAERATMIARYLNAPAVAAETAGIWIEAQPDNTDALTNAAVALMQSGQMQAAFGMSQRLQALEHETLYQSIAASSGALNTTERSELLESYRQQLQKTPDDEQLLVGTGLLLQMQGDNPGALQKAQQALKLYPESIPASLLEATLLQQLGRDQEALGRMARLLERHPDNQRLRLQYARILTRHDLKLAQQEFATLTEQSPGDADLRLSLGLVALEAGDLDTAHQAFEQLLDDNQHLSPANFYLAQIAERQDDIPRAIMHYLQVGPGRDLSTATNRLLSLLVGKGDLDSARAHIIRLGDETPELREGLEQAYVQALIQYQHYAAAETQLDAALTQTPTSHSLLFTRSLLHEKLGRLEAAEQDLRAILAQDPNNSAALNALGYILTDHNLRLDEARELLAKAIALNPDDAAIIDSIGWLHFRTGNYPEALNYLRRAYAAHPDAEIAAHLGEVLWVIDQREEARKIWREGLNTEPDNAIILRALERLQVPPL